MKKNTVLLPLFTVFLVFFSIATLKAQKPNTINGIPVPNEIYKIKPWEEVYEQKTLEKLNNGSQVIFYGRNLKGKDNKKNADYDLPLNPNLKPFYHSVASGDPLPNAIIIWTRVTPDTDQTLDVEWLMATDTALTNIVQTGTFVTDSARDYTVKVDVTNLNPATTYYYQFKALGKKSAIGRTRTAPASADNVQHLRFGVVSCSNYQHGYFNAYEKLAKRYDLEAVIHLGDYIYEYELGGYGNERNHIPEHEILNLDDYRTRHSLYKLDPDLQAAHQQHAFIVTWDDHEIANNAYLDGADNHNPLTEGSWDDRKKAAKKAYFEWMPIRDNDTKKVYRTIQYGNLIDLIMIDTRHEGRQIQLDVNDTAANNPNRTILGTEQYNWFLKQLKNSTAKWKIVGNQVCFTPINTASLIENSDMWDGYKPERDKVFASIDSNNLKNIIFITGDIHLGICADVTQNPSTYNPQTGEGSVAIEWVATSVTSSNLDETFPDLDPNVIINLAKSLNPHAKFVDVTNHGYMLLDVKTDSTQADWYWMNDILSNESDEYQQNSWYVKNGETFNRAANTPQPSNANYPNPAPPILTAINNPQAWIKSDNYEPITILTTYPNPATNTANISYALLQNNMPLSISIYNLQGKKINTLTQNLQQAKGVYNLQINVSNLPAGIYTCVFETSNGFKTHRKIVVQK